MRIHAPSFKRKLYSLIPFIVYPDGQYSWHNWFAWKPVRVGSTLVFLETIERRKRARAPKVPGVPGISFIYEWVYRLPGCKIEDIPGKSNRHVFDPGRGDIQVLNKGDIPVCVAPSKDGFICGKPYNDPIHIDAKES